METPHILLPLPELLVRGVDKPTLYYKLVDFVQKELLSWRWPNGTKDRTWPREWGVLSWSASVHNRTDPMICTARLCGVYIYILIAGYTYPPEKYESQIGSSSQLFRKNKNMFPNHQPACVCVFVFS